MRETGIQARVQIALSEFGARVFRNQVGTYKLPSGDVVSSGLCKGSSDLIGWHRVLVTADMVGKEIAVFTSVEVKSEKGRLEKPQLQWLKTVHDQGGIAIVARSAEEAVKKIDEYRPGTEVDEGEAF